MRRQTQSRCEDLGRFTFDVKIYLLKWETPRGYCNYFKDQCQILICIHISSRVSECVISTKAIKTINDERNSGCVGLRKDLEKAKLRDNSDCVS